MGQTIVFWALLSALAAQVPSGPQAPASPPATTPPVLVKSVEAFYPEEAAKAGAQGVVHLVLFVSKEGKVTRVLVENPLGHGLDEAATAAAKQFLFAPARQGEAPVDAVVEIDYSFTVPAPAANAPDGGAPAQPGPAPAPTAPASVAAPKDAPLAQAGSLSGLVREMGTRLPLAGARVALPTLGREAQTEADGRFEIAGLPPGGHLLTIELPDYFILSTYVVVQEGQRTEQAFSVDPKTTRAYETLVRDRQNQEPESIRVSQKESRQVPGIEDDPVRVVQYLPGVARAPMGLPVLVIRGSLPRESTVLLDGHTIPFVYHLGVLKTVLSADLIDSVDFMPGGFGVFHGDRLGGIVDVRTRKPRSDAVHGSATPGLLDSNLTLEAPIPWIPKLILSGGASYGYLGPLTRAVLGDAAVGVPLPGYYDYQVRADYEPAARQRLTVLGFGAGDMVSTGRSQKAAPDESALFEQSDAFHAIQVRHELRFGDHLNSLSASFVRHRTSEQIGTFKMSNREDTFELRENVELAGGPGFKLQGGYFGQAIPLSQDSASPPGDASAAQMNSSLPRKASNVFFYNGLYAEARWRPRGGLLLAPGIRFNYTLFAHGVRPSATLDPRLALRFSVDERTTAKASLGLLHQSAKDAWLVPALLPEQALHATVGVERKLLDALQLNAELFYKRLWSLVVSPADLQLGAGGSYSPVGPALSNQGEGRAYGLELLLRQDLAQSFFGWVAYTLSRSERRRSSEPFHLFDMDQTHLLTVVGCYKLPYHWDLSLAFRFASGSPETPILYGLYDADRDTYLPAPGETNSARLKPFHQLDLRVAKTWAFELWRLSFFLDLMNVYNQKHPEISMWSFDYSRRQELSGVGFYPSVGLKGEW